MTATGMIEYLPLHVGDWIQAGDEIRLRTKGWCAIPPGLRRNAGKVYQYRRPVHYVFLRPGDIVQEGDEITTASYVKWVRCSVTVGDRVKDHPSFNFRRKVGADTQTVKLEPIIVPEEEEV